MLPSFVQLKISVQGLHDQVQAFQKQKLTLEDKIEYRDSDYRDQGTLSPLISNSDMEGNVASSKNGSIRRSLHMKFTI